MRIDEIIQDLNAASEAEQLAAVKQVGLAIRFINNPSEAVQLAAIKQNGVAILLIKNPSIDLLNSCKHEIIKAILITIRNGNMVLASGLFQIIQNTNWPEVAIIEKSLAVIERNK
jgi:hypothetical protein